MRVAIVVEWLDAARGGAETSTGQFISELVDRGIEVEVFTRSSWPDAPGLRVLTFQTRPIGRAAATASFIRWAQAQIVSSGCDLSHAFVSCIGADIYQPRGGLTAETIRRTAASRRTAVGRLIKSLAMRMNARQRLVLGLERRLLTGDRKPVVIAISGYVSRQLREHYNYPDSHIREILNGVQVVTTSSDQRQRNHDGIRKQYGIMPDDLLLLAVCHNYRLKGVGSLIEAMGEMKRRGQICARAIVVGREDPHSWRRLAARFGVSDAVVFTGPADGIERYFHAADVLVHATYYDPCSRVVLEAVTHGLPVITTRFDGAAEVLKDGVSGFVVSSPVAIESMVMNIEALADPERRRRMGQAAEARANDVTMARHVGEVVELYQVLKGRGPMGKIGG